MILPVSLALCLPIVHAACQQGVDCYHRETDHDDIVKICVDNPAFLLPRNSPNPVAEVNKLLHERGHQTLVYRIDGRVVGFIIYSKVEQPFMGLLFFRQKGVIWLLGVDEKFRGRGFGKKLISSCCDDLEKQDVTHVELYLLSDNDKGRAVYERLGFKKISKQSEVPGYAMTLLYRKDFE